LWRRGALFPSGRWRRFLQRRIPYEQIEEAAIPLRITATDLADAAPVIFDSGPVLDAVMASTSLPGVWPPYRIGEHQYLDGALSDPVSLKPAIDAGTDTIYVLAVSASYPPPDRHSARAGEVPRRPGLWQSRPRRFQTAVTLELTVDAERHKEVTSETRAAAPGPRADPATSCRDLTHC
ncbi:MAG: patatin-like phospholipase family protein, partial [Pseudonocardiales bacterium]|nr:patatin-like phospholipase family protein [Pseudonocardiales bacterium]